MFGNYRDLGQARQMWISGTADIAPTGVPVGLTKADGTAVARAATRSTTLANSIFDVAVGEMPKYSAFLSHCIADKVDSGGTEQFGVYSLTTTKLGGPAKGDLLHALPAFTVAGSWVPLGFEAHQGFMVDVITALTTTAGSYTLVYYLIPLRR